MADRHARLVALSQVGSEGLARLAECRVLHVGMGGLGCASAPYLARAGVGHLTLVDADVVRETDLGRQMLFSPDDLGRSKAEVAAERLSVWTRTVSVPYLLCRENLNELVKDADVIVDGTDSWAPRVLMNHAYVRLGKPVVFGGALGGSGFVTVSAHGGPCLRCLWTESPGDQSCETAGVLGPLVGMVGALQATEAIKVLLGLPNLLTGRLAQIDAWRGDFRTLRYTRRPNCLACGPDTT